MLQLMSHEVVAGLNTWADESKAHGHMQRVVVLVSWHPLRATERLA